MEKCVNRSAACMNLDGKEYRLIKGKCCLDEVKEDKEIIQAAVDCIESCEKSTNSLSEIASKISYTTSLINHNNEIDLIEVLPLLKRYSMLLFEFRDKIISDESISTIIYSFNIELLKWFKLRFLQVNTFIESNNLPYQSIVADFQTVEMSLGVCMIECPDDGSLDDLFF